jgi:group I intron endonuclease
VGSASTNKFNSRFTNHLIYFNGSKILKNSVNKYKLFNFCFIVLELFPEVVTQENNKNLLDLEDFYLKSLLPDYNILTEAGSSFGYKHTEVSRLQMKSVYSEERRKKIGELNKGKTFSPETIEAMKQAALIRKNRNFSEEAILNLKKNSKAILVKELSSGIIYGRYPSIIEAALALNCSSKTIQRSLKSPSKQLKRRWIVYYD